MSKIELVDTTMRDGNQSLWGATALKTGMQAAIAPVMERVGFGAVDLITSTHMAVAVRFQKENPWERIRVMRELMPSTKLSFLTTGMRFISWESASQELMALAFKLLINSGIDRFAIMDPMNDTSAMTAMAALARKCGVDDCNAALTYTVSPFHDDAYYAKKTAEIAASGRFTRIYVKDPGGLLTPERARTLLPAIQAAKGRLPLELHSHCTIGLAPFSYLAAAELGIDALHVAARPAANGTSQPAAERMVANLRHIGHTVDVDDEALADMSSYFQALADAEGLDCGKPQEFDASYFKHQMPGGMLGTMKRQLGEMKRLHLLPQVLEETERVRADLGYPIMVTPFSQVVGAQAVMNVLSGKRYENIPDEVIRYVIGRFGKPGSPLDAEIEDRIRSSPRASVLEKEDEMAPLPELRKRFGEHLCDEEFLLRAVMPREQVDAMLAAGPADRSYDPYSRPHLELIGGLAKRKGYRQIAVETKGLRLKLERGFK